MVVVNTFEQSSANCFAINAIDTVSVYQCDALINTCGDFFFYVYNLPKSLSCIDNPQNKKMRQL